MSVCRALAADEPTESAVPEELIQAILAARRATPS
jgi:hypothetical protein